MDGSDMQAAIEGLVAHGDSRQGGRAAARDTSLVLFPGHVLPIRPGAVERTARTAHAARFVAHAARAARLPGVDAFFAEGGRALHRSEVMAPLVVAIGLSAFAELEREGLPDDARLLGHSLGELTALAAAGALDAEAAIDLAAVCGRALDDAAARVPGSLYVVRGDEVAHALRIGGDLVEIAIDNAADEVILGGSRTALAAVGRVVPGLWLRGVPAFHTRAMDGARPVVEDAVAAIDVRTPRRSVFSAVTVGPVLTARAVAATLVRAVSWRVRFREALELAATPAARHVAVVAPGGPIAAVVRRSLRASEVREVG